MRHEDSGREKNRPIKFAKLLEIVKHFKFPFKFPVLMRFFTFNTIIVGAR